MTVDQRRRKIVGVLERDADHARLAKRINGCQKGACRRCGDLCPVEAARWMDAHISKIVGLLASKGSEPILQLRYTRDSWSRKDSELALPGLSLYEKQDRRVDHEHVFASLVGIEKALRRAFDKLNGPKVLAIGMIDAWYGYASWNIGGSLIVAGITESELYNKFPAGQMEIESVSDIRMSLRKLLAQSRRAKLMPPYDAVMRMSRQRQQEYFVWLASMESNARLFRYGCDRYFNRLRKVKRTAQPKPIKRHPYPRWLTPHMFNNHPLKCQCKACGGLEKYYRSG